MTRADYRLPPCDCPECRQAGMDTKERVRDPHTGEVLHGHRLKRWYDAFERFKQQARAAVGTPGRHAGGFERLAK